MAIIRNRGLQTGFFMRKAASLPLWGFALLSLAVVFLALLAIYLIRSRPASAAPVVPPTTAPSPAKIFRQSASPTPIAPTESWTATVPPASPTAPAPTATPVPAEPLAVLLPPTATPQEAVQPTRGPRIIANPVKIGVSPELEFKSLLGNSGESSALLSRLQESGRQPDMVGFATWYYLPNGMNAYRTMFHENACIVAVNSRLQDDLAIGMHFALITVDAPTPSAPFMAYVGDIGPLGDIQMTFADNGNAVQVLSGGEPLVIDVPVGCFTTYINSDRRTSHVSVYLLTAAETLEYLESLPLGRP